MQYATLVDWVNQNSGSCHLEGLARMADALAAHMADIPGQLERVPLPAYTNLDGTRHQPGDALRLRFRPEAPGIGPVYSMTNRPAPTRSVAYARPRWSIVTSLI